MEHRGQEKDMGLPNPNPMSYNPSQLNQQESSSSAANKFLTAPNRTTNEHENTIFSPNQTLDQHNITQNSDPDPVRQLSTSSASERNITPVRYKECLKNHAANLGGYVLDGCGEFMPSGEEETLEYLKCAACDCHRNFHRKETEDESQTPGVHRNNHRIPNQTPPSLPAVPTQQQHHHKYPHSYPRGHMAPVMMSFGGNTGVAAESSSEDQIENYFNEDFWGCYICLIDHHIIIHCHSHFSILLQRYLQRPTPSLWPFHIYPLLVHSSCSWHCCKFHALLIWPPHIQHKLCLSLYR